MLHCKTDPAKKMHWRGPGLLFTAGAPKPTSPSRVSALLDFFSLLLWAALQWTTRDRESVRPVVIVTVT